MNAHSPIDMTEIMRLTQAGQLADAMALIQGKVPTAGAAAGSARPTIDMVAPAQAGGAWTSPTHRTSPDLRTARPAFRAQGKGLPSGQAEMTAGVRALLDRLGTAASGRGGLPGSGLGGFPDLGRAGTTSRPAKPLPEGARFEARSFSNHAGSRGYKLYVPSGYKGQAMPLVVMLHGCTQSPDDFAAGTRMNELAEAETFLVAYPGQTQSANAQKCWNWFSPGDQQRDRGEPALIAGITREVADEFSADPTRIYVAGLSAGGAAAAIMGAVYPDLYAAIGVHSGLACGAAQDMPSAFAAMRQGGGAAVGSGAGRIPTIVFHGDADRTVAAVNADQIIAGAHTAGLTSTISRGESPGGTAYTRAVKADPSGRTVLEQWTLHKAGHAWSGGSPDGSYTDPRGPDASREMLRFFLQHAAA